MKSLSKTIPVASPMQATVVSVDVKEEDRVIANQPIAILEAMKMEHVVTASASGIVRRINVRPGDMVFEGHALLFIEPSPVEAQPQEEEVSTNLDHIRSDLAEVIERHAAGSDERRAEAVARRRKTGQRTARETSRISAIPVPSRNTVRSPSPLNAAGARWTI